MAGSLSPAPPGDPASPPSARKGARTDNPPMRFSPRTIGLLAAVVTVTIWTGFIIIARASAQRTLTPFDIALLRIVGASLVLLPWGWWMVRRRHAALGASAPASSLAGICALSLHVGTTVSLAAASRLRDACSTARRLRFLRL